MTKYGSDDFTIEVDDDEGGTLTDISAYVDEYSGFEIQALTEESHAFGDSWVEHLYSGVRMAGDVTFTGFYDDVASGPNAIFAGQEGETRTLKLTWGSTKTSTVETIVQQFTRTPNRGGSTRWSVTLRPTGAVTEA